MELKLDELIRAVTGARTSQVRREDFSDDQLAELQREFERLRERLTGERQNGELRTQP
jgi:hypothetical protein